MIILFKIVVVGKKNNQGLFQKCLIMEKLCSTQELSEDIPQTGAGASLLIFFPAVETHNLH